MIKLNFIDKKNINRMLLVSILILIFIGFFSEQIEKIRIILYVLCALVGLFSIRYTFVIIILTYTYFLSMYSELDIVGGIPTFGLIAGLMCFIGETSRYLKANKYRISKKIIYKGIYILFIIFLLASSILVAKMRYGQPIIRGVYSFRNLLIILYIFPFTKLLKDKKNEKIVIMEYLTKLITFSIFVIIIQVLLMNKVQFLKLMEASRYKEERILIHSVSTLYCFVFAYILNIFFETKKINKFRVITLVLIVIAIFVISRTRMFMIGICVISFFEILILSNIKITNKIFLSIIGIITAFIVLFGTNFITNITNGLFKDVTTEKDSYIRVEAIEYHMNFIKDDFFLLGAGITNEKYEPSPVNEASKKGYLLADIGIFAVFFEYGIMGLFALLLLTFNIFRNSFKIKDRIVSNLAKLFFVFIVATMYTVSPITTGVWIIYIIIYSMLYAEKYRN